MDDLLRLRAAERAAADGLVVQVGYNVRLAESVTRTRKLLDDNVIGEVVSVSARGAALVGEHLTQHLNQPADMGAVLWILGCHMLGALVSVFGTPESVNARVHKPARLSELVIASPTPTHVDLMSRAAAMVRRCCVRSRSISKSTRCSTAAGACARIRCRSCWASTVASTRASRRCVPRSVTGAIGTLEQLIITSRDPAPAPRVYIRIRWNLP